jgi:hypothetical protein
VPNWIALNQIKQSNTKACITKSCDVCTLLRYYTAYSGNPTPTFWDILSVPTSRVKKFKRENIAPGMLTYTIFFYVTSSIVRFLKTQNVSEAGSVSVFRQRSTLPGGSLIDKGR